MATIVTTECGNQTVNCNNSVIMCRVCKIKKQEHEFAKDRHQSSGIRFICKQCVNKKYNYKIQCTCGSYVTRYHSNHTKTKKHFKLLEELALKNQENLDQNPNGTLEI